MGPCKTTDRLSMRIPVSIILGSLALFFIFGFYAEKKQPFTFIENPQGIELLEAGQKVFFYQKEPKSLDGRYICNNYLHPLYSLEGDILTEEFPADHVFHRGIFWAWHQMYIDNQSIGNGWVMQNISQEVFQVKPGGTKNTARLDLDVHWKSSAWQNGRPYVHEHTTILVHRTKGVRKIDFEIRLKALVPGVSLGGADDEKGYGGLCLRIKTPEDLIFTSTNGPVTPQNLQITAGSWMDFSGTFRPDSEKSGITLLSHPTLPNYPPTWILRQTRSMQNVVFPGRYRTEIPMDKPVILRYRLIVHKGNDKNGNIARLKAEYDRYTYPD